MSSRNGNEAREQDGAGAPQSTVFRRPCFQIALQGSGAGAKLGVRVVAAPAQRRG